MDFSGSHEAALGCVDSGRVPAAVMWVIRIGVLYALFWTMLWVPLSRDSVDYPKHWEAARALIDGQSVYRGSHLWIEFNYPQAMVFNFAWLGFFDYAVAERIWKLFLGLSIAGCWYIAWRMYLPPACRGGSRGVRWGWITAAVIGFYQPAMSSLSEGNIDAYNALLIVLMVSLVLVGREYTAGLVWGLLVSVKLIPVLLLIPLLLWKKWKILQGGGIFLVAYLALLLLTGRLDEEWYFLTGILPVLPEWWRESSVSVLRLIFMLSGREEDYMNDPYSYLAGVRVFLCAVVAVFICILFVLRTRGKPFLSGLESAIIIFPLLSPLFWYHHLVWILPVLLLQFSAMVRHRYGRLMAVGLISGWVLLQVPWLFLRHSSIDHTWKDFAYLVGYLMVIFLTVVSVFTTPSRLNAVEFEQAQQAEGPSIRRSM